MSLIRGGILTNGLAAPVITDANYSGSAWRLGLKLILSLLLLLLLLLLPSPLVFKRRERGFPGLPLIGRPGMTRKCPPSPNMASYLISTLAMGGKKVSAARRGKRYYDFRRFIRLIRVRGIFFRFDWSVWGTEGGGDYETLGFVPRDVYCSCV